VPSEPRRIIGVDPGSRRTGFGVVEVRGGTLVPIRWGVLVSDPEAPFPDRLHTLHEGLCAVLKEFSPAEAAVEQVFLSRNVSSALKLGMVRGALIVACRSHGAVVREFSPKEIKVAATGFGGAGKEQVAGMVSRLLGIREPLPDDASDALAMAICAAVTRLTAPGCPSAIPAPPARKVGRGGRGRIVKP
jgi:crossover junction endodeoxyribonuclease RuvC